MLQLYDAIIQDQIKKGVVEYIDAKEMPEDVQYITYPTMRYYEKTN